MSIIRYRPGSTGLVSTSAWTFALPRKRSTESGRQLYAAICLDTARPIVGRTPAREEFERPPRPPGFLFRNQQCRHRSVHHATGDSVRLCPTGWISEVFCRSSPRTVTTGRRGRHPGPCRQSLCSWAVLSSDRVSARKDPSTPPCSIAIQPNHRTAPPRCSGRRLGLTTWLIRL